MSDASGVDPANEESEGIDETGEEDEDASFCQRDADVNGRADGRSVRATEVKSVLGVMKDMLVVAVI